MAILNALPLAVVVVDREERVVYANPLAERLLADRLELGRAVPWWGPESRLAAPACAVNGLVGGFEWGAVHANAAVIPSATGGMLRPMRIALAPDAICIGMVMPPLPPQPGPMNTVG